MAKPAQKNGAATIAQAAIAGGLLTIRPVSSGTQASRAMPTHPDEHTQRMLVELHNRTQVLEQSAALFAGARLHTGLAFTGGTAKTFPHLLSRPYKGYIVTRQTVAASLVEQALPTTYTNDKYISLLSASSGTFDVLVF